MKYETQIYLAKFVHIRRQLAGVCGVCGDCEYPFPLDDVRLGIAFHVGPSLPTDNTTL